MDPICLVIPLMMDIWVVCTFLNRAAVNIHGQGFRWMPVGIIILVGMILGVVPW